MKLLSTHGLLIFFLVIIGCENKDKIQEEQLQKEVLEVHDELMPRMQDIEQLKRELEERKETLDSLADEQVALFNELINQLSESGESMMDWMRNYSQEYKEMKHDEIMDYLDDQKEKVEEAKEKINRAIDAAESELKEYD